MRKLYILLFCILFVGLITKPCFSEENRERTGASVERKNGIELYLNSGISFPSRPDEFADYWSAGFNFGGGIGHSVNPNLSLVGYFDFNDFGFDEDSLLRDYGLAGYGVLISGGEASSMTLSGTLKATLVTPPAKVRPYLCGGIGISWISISDVTIYYLGESATVPGESESAFSILVGAGIDFVIAKGMDLFIEGRYAIAFTEGESTAILPFKLGIKFR
jgi:hypothetical protein